MSPASAGGFFTTEPPGKSSFTSSYNPFYSSSSSVRGQRQEQLKHTTNFMDLKNNTDLADCGKLSC